MKKTKNKYNLALVLGGGGARGLAHIGVIRKLINSNIKPDLIIGTSMGAVVGGMYAQCGDIDLVEKKISDFIESFKDRGRWLNFLKQVENETKHNMFHDIANYIKLHFLKLKTITHISLEEQEILFEPLSEFFTNDDIKNCRIPFAAVAIDVKKGREVVLTSGSIIKAVYASAAVQGVFPPLEYNEMFLCDGGPVALIPVEIARKFGAKKIIAVDVSMKLKKEEEITSGLKVILRSDDISQNRLKKMDLKMADFVITPSVGNVHWANFEKLKYCVIRGEIATEKALSQINNTILHHRWWKRLFR